MTSQRLLEDPNAPEIRRLEEVLRGDNGTRELILIDDADNIAQALHYGLELLGVYTAGDATADETLGEALDAEGVPLFTLPAYLAKDLFGKSKRSRIFALARTPEPRTLGALAEAAGDVVVLDGVRLAGNIGAITRTSFGLGAAGVVAVNSGLASPWDRRIIRASRGMVFALPVVLATADEVKDFFAENDLPLIGLDAHAEHPVQDMANHPGRLGLLMGSERTGASAELADAVDRNYVIPTRPGIESLNVSVATALALFAHQGAE